MNPEYVVQFEETILEPLPDLPDIDAEEKAMPFPVHALPPSMRELVEQCAKVHQVQPELPAMIALGTLSGAIGKGIKLQGVRNGVEGYGNLYIVAAAEAGTGKGNTGQVIAGPLLQASRELEEHWRKNIAPEARAEVAFCNAKISAKNGEAKKPDADRGLVICDLTSHQAELDAAQLKLRAPTYWVGNSTSEALGMTLESVGETILIYSPEAGDVLRVMGGRYRADAKGDYDLLLSGYSSEPFRLTRVTRESVNIKPTISAVLLVQPSILFEVLGTPEAMERGLIARCLFFDASSGLIPHDTIVNYEIEQEVLERWDKFIRQCLEIRDMPGKVRTEPHIVTCSPEAREMFLEFHNETVDLRNKELADIQCTLSRFRENAARIALNLAVAARGVHVETLTVEDAQAGVEIMRWIMEQTVRLLDATRRERAEKRAERLSDILKEAGGSKTLGRLANSNGFKAAEVRILVERFPARFSIEKVQQGGRGGRPSEVVRRLKE